MICGIDIYHGDYGDKAHGTKPDFDRYFDLGDPWHFYIVKVADGNVGQDFGSETIADFRHVAHARGLYNVSQFVAPYVFARAGVDPAAQGDALVHKMDISGLLKDPSMIPWIDVERDSRTAQGASDTGWESAQHVIDIVGGIIAHVRARTGQFCGVYGRTVWNDLSVPSTAGAAYNWNPDYSADGKHHMKSPPWSRAQTVLRQYTDGQDKNVSGLPDFPLGGFDANVWLGRADSERDSLDAFREAMTGQAPGGFLGAAAVAAGLGLAILT